MKTSNSACVVLALTTSLHGWSPSKGCFSLSDPFPPYNLAEMDDFSNQTNLDLIFDTYYSTRVSQCGTGFEFPEDCKNMSFSELFGQELLSPEENKDCKITIKIEKNDSLDTTNKHCLINTEENISLSSSLSKSSIAKKGINRTLIKNTNNCDVEHLMNYPFCIEDLRDNQIFMKPMLPVTKSELKITNTIIDKTILEVESSSCSFAADFCNTTSTSPKKHQSINRKTSTKKCDAGNFNLSGSENQLLVVKIPQIKKLDHSNDITVQTIFGMRPYNYVDASQKKTDDHGFVKIKEEVLSSSSKTPSSSYHDVNSAYVKLTDVKDLIHKSCDKNNVEDNQMPVKTEKCKHENIAKTEITTCYSVDDSYITDCQNFAKDQKVEKDILSFQSDNVVHKLGRKNKVSVKPTKHCGIKQIEHKPFTDSSLVKAKMSSVKNESIDFNLDHTPCFTANKSQNTSINHSKISTTISNVVSMCPKNNSSKKIIKDHKPYDKTHNLGTKKKNDLEPSLAKSSSPKWHGVNRISTKITDDQKLTDELSLKPKTQSIEQSLSKTKTSITEQKPKVITNAVENTIDKFEVVPSYSSSNVIKKSDSPNIVKYKKDFFTVLSESVIPKRQVVRRTIKSLDKHNKQEVKKSAYEVKGQNNGVTKVIKNEPKDQEVNLIVEGTLKKMIDGESKFAVDSNEFCSNDVTNTITESQEAVIVKEENETSLKNDTSLQTITLDIEKKKITWEEFRAKRKKMGIVSMLGDNEDLSKDKTTDISEWESILEEFDRNTAVHFINQKRKIDETDEQNISAAEENNKLKDLDLQNKRMKIEYFQKLLPTSLASEIAKTSSLMKGILVEDNNEHNNDIDNTSSDSTVSSNKTQSNSCNTEKDLIFKQDDKSVKKNNQTKINSSHCGTSRSEYSTKNGRSSILSHPDNYYHRNRNDIPLHVGHYGKSVRNPVKRTKDQKKVVYVGQIPIKYGKPYLLERFEQFGTVISITLHQKPDFRVYYAFVTYSNKTEAERAINHGNDDKTHIQLDIRFGERKQTQTPYYDLDDEWLTDWYGYNNQPLAIIRPPPSPKKVSFEQELQEFYKLAQIKKLNYKSSQTS